jgi:hypothetical protein
MAYVTYDFGEGPFTVWEDDPVPAPTPTSPRVESASPTPVPAPLPTVTNTGVVTSPPQVSIAADYDSYWKNAAIGSYTDFAGGVIYRYSEDKANFISGTNRKDYTIRADSNLNEIANIIPEVGAVWKEEYGFNPTPLPTAPDYYSPVQFAYADADRDLFATRREVALDPEIRNVDLSNIRDRNQAWEKLAVELYGGKNMTIEDIARIEGATGAVGRYSLASNGTYFLPPEAVQEIAQLNRITKSPLPVESGTLDALGRPQFVQGSPEFIRAEQLAREASREDIRRAAIANGFPPDAAIPTMSYDGKVFITLANGKDIDITSYFEGNPKPPVAIDTSVPTYGTSTVTTPFRQVTVTALPEVARTVNTSEGSIVVDANSETARFIQWQGSQYDPNNGGLVRETWARQGISDPYADPRLVAQAQTQIGRADARTSLFNQNGVTPPGSQIAPWNDPNWPAYQGSNREAYNIASAALTDANVKNQLKAENGWDEATFQSWALRSTNPEEAARQARISDAAAGLVAGPVSGGSTGLSVNGATVVAVTGLVNSSGFANASFSSVASNAGVPTDLAGAAGAATNAVNNVLASVPSVPTNLAGIATGFAAGFTDALPTLPSVTGALQLTAAQVAGLAQQAESAADALVAGIRSLPERIPDNLTGFVSSAVDSLVQASGLGVVTDLLTRQNATIRKAKEQATLQARNNEASTPDWRVRLQLAPGAQYLYKDPEPGILAPLFQSDGVIFPYTPTIETSYAANYDKYDLTHSNYRGYFYKNSVVNDINIRGVFTAQDTAEAEYMLAVIHFFRSVTRMFYGQDSLRGAPPPLVYLSGFGEYQFNDHPCLVSNFSYSLPNEVDYIRAWGPNNYGNLFSQRAKTGGISTNPLSAVLSRLTAAGINPAAIAGPPTPSSINQNVNNLTGATYVPTKIEINITLLPTNTRSEISQQFSVKEFANGSLLKGGFW